MVRRHNYSLKLSGDGYAMWEYGLLRVLDGSVLLCGTNLATFAKEFDGQWVELAICSPQPSDPTPMDPLIEPLVRRLQKLGYTTVSSCQGHIDPEIWWRHPFVTFWGKPNILIAPTWDLTQVGLNLWNLHVKGVADTEEQLAFLQALIPDQLEALK